LVRFPEANERHLVPLREIFEQVKNGQPVSLVQRVGKSGRNHHQPHRVLLDKLANRWGVKFSGTTELLASDEKLNPFGSRTLKAVVSWIGTMRNERGVAGKQVYASDWRPNCPPKVLHTVEAADSF
jgi:hypothetical protein